MPFCVKYICVVQMASGGSSGEAGGVKARLILQQCLSARLMVQPETDSNPAEFVEVSW